jgi:hypothetical protein
MPSFECPNCKVPVIGLTTHDVTCSCGFFMKKFSYTEPKSVYAVPKEQMALVDSILAEYIK